MMTLHVANKDRIGIDKDEYRFKNPRGIFAWRTVFLSGARQSRGGRFRPDLLQIFYKRKLLTRKFVARRKEDMQVIDD
jgi:hypothetical protein